MKNVEMHTSNIFSELGDRLSKVRKVSFWLYFVLIIIGLGGLGVIVSLVNSVRLGNWEELPLTIMTYSLAILVPACLSIILRLFHQVENKVSLVLLCVASIVFTALFTFNANIVGAILCPVLAWFFWAVANADNIEMDDNAYNMNIKKDLGDHGKDWN